MGRGRICSRGQRRRAQAQAYSEAAILAYAPMAREPIITGLFCDLASLMEVVFDGVEPVGHACEPELPQQIQQRLQEVSAGGGAGLVEALMPPYLPLGDDCEGFDGAEYAAVDDVDVEQLAPDPLAGLESSER